MTKKQSLAGVIGIHLDRKVFRLEHDHLETKGREEDNLLVYHSVGSFGETQKPIQQMNADFFGNSKCNIGMTNLCMFSISPDFEAGDKRISKDPSQISPHSTSCFSRDPKPLCVEYRYFTKVVPEEKLNYNHSMTKQCAVNNAISSLALL